MFKRIVLCPWCPWLVFLCVSFFTLARLPYTYFDEVYFAEPARNCASGRGFISLGWHNQAPTQMAVTTAPLFSAVLVAVFKVAGAGLVSSRLPSFLFGATALLLLWRGGERSGLVQTSKEAALLFWLGLFGFSIFLSCSSCRPDSLNMLLSSAVFCAVSAAADNRRLLPLVFLSAALVPLNGVQLLFYALILIGCCFLVLERKYWLPLGFAAAGTLIGVAVFRIGYGAVGLWDEYLRCVRTEGPDNILGRVIRRLTTNPFRNYHDQVPREYSLPFLCAGVLVLTASEVRAHGFGANKAVVFITAYMLTLPAGMWLVGKFPTHYAWMLYLPLILLVPRLFRNQSGKRPRVWAAVCLALAVLAGMPLELTVAAADWPDRDYSKLEAWARTRIKPNDVVYCDCAAYFAAVPIAGKVYPAHDLQRLPAKDIEEINVLVLHPLNLHPKSANLEKGVRLRATPARPRTDVLLERLGGEWVTDDDESYHPRRPGFLGNSFEHGMLSLANYDFVVYRRAK